MESSAHGLVPVPRPKAAGGSPGQPDSHHRRSTSRARRPREQALHRCGADLTYLPLCPAQRRTWLGKNLVVAASENDRTCSSGTASAPAGSFAQANLHLRRSRGGSEGARVSGITAG
jgi:hypothetical protein